MTHEPECISYDGGHVCVCDIIRAAYQRGREDAAKAVGELCSSNKKDENGWYLFDHCYECMGVAAGYDLAVADAVAAARWDGKQA